MPSQPPSNLGALPRSNISFPVFSPCHDFEQPDCPRCGETSLLPETAQYAGQGLVRHIWVCDGCGQVFQTVADPLKN